MVKAQWRKMLGAILIVAGLASLVIPALSIASMFVETSINVRIHVTDTKNTAISLAAVNVLDKLKYTNVYGDVDFPLPKSTKEINVAISKKEYFSFTKTYLIPEKLTNDDFKIDVQLTPIYPETQTAIDLTRLDAPPSSQDLKISGGLILFGLIVLFYPEKKRK